MTDNIDKIYKLALNWNRKLYYDGYLILRSNGEIVGYSGNETFFYGIASDKFFEVTMGDLLPNMIGYEVKDIFEELALKKANYAEKMFYTENNQIKMYLEALDPKLCKCFNTKIIEDRVGKILKNFPKDIIEAIKKSYLTGGS